jgi:hypothetical protein
MISEFLVYLRLGFEHIADPRGYDHILFIVALTAMYVPRAWRQVVALVTAFTVGHSITLALATLGFVRIPTDLIEFLIPLTILLTAVSNRVELRREQHGRRAESRDPEEARGKPSEARDEAKGEPEPGPRRGQGVRYTLALGFGLIHGLGFSNFLRAVLGGESSIVWPLFAFNVGLEIGQVLIVAIVLAATAVATGLLRIPQRGWIVALSGTAGTMAVYLLWQRLPVG